MRAILYTIGGVCIVVAFVALATYICVVIPVIGLVLVWGFIVFGLLFILVELGIMVAEIFGWI